MSSIDENVKEQGLVRKVFAEEMPTAGNFLASAGFAFGARTWFSHVAPDFLTSDAAISAGATLVDGLAFWGTFIPQLAYRDRHHFKKEDDSYNWKSIGKKAGEYTGLVGTMEAAYAFTSGTAQFWLQKKGIDPMHASLISQGVNTAFYALALPFVRYGLRQLSEK